MSLKKIKYVIVGAGITGLSVAADLGLKEDYMVIEKESTCGGLCRTFYKNGFVWDYGGHFFHFNRSEIREEFKGILESKSSHLQKKNSKIYHNGQWIDYPFQKNIHQLEKKEFIECLVGLFSEKNTTYSNFGEMICSKYGSGISERFLIPYNEKLYDCDLDELDVEAMGRFFPNVDPITIVRSFGERIETYNDTFYYSDFGALVFVNEIKKRVDEERIKLNTKVKKIDTDNRVVYTSDSEIYYDYLINTIPLPKLFDVADLNQHKEFTANKVVVFNMGFDREATDNKIHWVYFASKDIVFYRVGFYSNILSSKPMSIYVEVGRNDYNDLGGLRDRVIKDLKKVGIITNHKLVDYNCLSIEPAYVHMRVGMSKKREKIMTQLEKKNIYSIGRYGGWRYCSIEDCIVSARETVRAIKNKEEKG